MHFGEARNRFKSLKKIVHDRSLITFAELIPKIDQKLSQRSKSS